MRSVFTLVLVAVIGSQAGRGVSPLPARPAWLVAHRYDDTRVIFSLGKTFADDPDLRRRNLAQNPTRLPDPAARLAGMALWKMDEAFWKRHAMGISTPAPGERWVLKAGGELTFHFVIQRLAMAEIACDTAIAAIGEVESADQASFKLVSAKHYLVAPEAGYVPVVTRHPGPEMLPVPPAISPAAKERLEASLQEQLQRELPRVRRVSAAPYALMNQLGLAHSWEERDERLAHGEGKLSYDVRAVRLTLDQQARWYVRARWSLEGVTVFLMSAWIWPERDMLVESVYTRPSEWMRMNEFQSERLGFGDLGLLLNVFDCDGDGRGEVLLAQRRLEGFHMHLLEYAEGHGFSRTDVSYRYGC